MEGAALPLSGQLGRPRLHLRRTGSTNDRARELALGGAPHGTLVSAAEQTAGRGRQGRRWSAPPGSSLLMSLVLRGGAAGPDGAERAPLPLIAAVAVCDLAGAQAQVKWPNDIVVEHEDGSLRKLAGILVEGRPQAGWSVLGIGVNVAVQLDELPVELRASAATLGLSRAEVEPALARLLQALERRLGEPRETTLSAWRARDALRGRAVRWNDGEGRAAGIDEGGRLIVTLASGERAALEAGEVHLTPARRTPPAS